MSRLPTPGGDSGDWGSILNDFLTQAHSADGSLKADSVGSAQLQDNAVTASVIAPNAVDATAVANGAITEALLDNTVQIKLNAVAGTPDWSTITNKPAVIAAGGDTASARAAIGAGTSNLTIGTTSGSAKAGDYAPASTDISDASATGRSLLVAASATTAKSALSLAKSDVGLNNVDNTSDASKPVSTAAQTALNNKAALVHTHTTAQITDATTIGASLLTAADAPSVRAAIGAGTSNLAIGTSSSTAKAGDYQPTTAAISDATAVGRSLMTAASPVAALTTLSITKSDIGLGNVDNTSDLGKPISTAAQTAFDDKADLVGGVIPTAQLPSLAFNSAVTVANQSAMLALTSSDVHPGDIAIRSDGAGSFILTGNDPSQLANWTLLNSPSAPVTSVNSQFGDVVLGKADIGLANVNNTSDNNKPISTATQTALNAKADLIGGVIPLSQLPLTVQTNVVTAASQAAMLALSTSSVQPGDFAIRSDGAGTFILTGSDPSQLANWTLVTPVVSVNGYTGAVALTKSDVGLGNVDNTFLRILRDQPEVIASSVLTVEPLLIKSDGDSDDIVDFAIEIDYLPEHNIQVKATTRPTEYPLRPADAREVFSRMLSHETKNSILLTNKPLSLNRPGMSGVSGLTGAVHPPCRADP